MFSFIIDVYMIAKLNLLFLGSIIGEHAYVMVSLARSDDAEVSSIALPTFTMLLDVAAC